MARQQQDGSNGRGKRLWIVLAGVIVAVLILAAFATRRREIPVRAATAERATIIASVQTNGKIEPINSFEAHAPVPITVRKVFVTPGQHVKSGQLLVQLEQSDAQANAARALAQLKAAQASLNAVTHGGTKEEVLTNQTDLVRARTERDAAQRNLDAMHRLQQKGAASAGEVADAENRLKTAQAQVSLLEQKQGESRYSSPEVARVQAQVEEARAAYDAAQHLINETNIRSPRDGIVYIVNVHEGQFVGGGELLVQVGDLSKVQLRAFVDEPDIGKLAPDQDVRVTWDAQPGRVWHGKVTQIPTTVVTRGTRNVGEFTCIVDNPDEKLLPNVNVSVNIIIAQHDNALTVPREAIRQDDGKRFVYQIVDGELKRRDIETALTNLTSTEIAAGLSDKAQVALGAANGQSLKNGMAVKVVEE